MHDVSVECPKDHFFNIEQCRLRQQPALLGVCQHGVDIRRDEAGQVIERPVEGEHPSEAWPADRQIPAFTALRSKQRELPLLEPGAPSADRVPGRREELQAKRRIGKLRTENAYGHGQRATLRRSALRRKVSHMFSGLEILRLIAS